MDPQNREGWATTVAIFQLFAVLVSAVTVFFVWLFTSRGKTADSGLRYAVHAHPGGLCGHEHETIEEAYTRCMQPNDDLGRIVGVRASGEYRELRQPEVMEFERIYYERYVLRLRREQDDVWKHPRYQS